MSEIQLQNDANTFKVLQSTLYPGAKKESIEMVIAYCTARKLDPLLKSVHIVQMKGRDVIMPGIGLYRILAARCGSYAGISKPIFGKDITETLTYSKKDFQTGKTVNVSAVVTYPESCTMVIRKIVQGHVCEFERTEYWKENSANNEMWFKRPRAQLVKCTESQLLRAAFPECITSEVTFEEMEGKELIGTAERIEKSIISAKPSEVIDSDGVISINDEIFPKLNDLIKELNISDQEVNHWCKRANVFTLQEMDSTKMGMLVSTLEHRKDMSQNGKELNHVEKA